MEFIPYFSFAESFVQNRLPLRTLNQAFGLGKLGEQTVLIFEKAFYNLKFEEVELARLSGVKLRSIQMYEQKVNDIDKAQAGTVYKLSRVLGCTIEDLLENPEV